MRPDIVNMFLMVEINDNGPRALGKAYILDTTQTVKWFLVELKKAKM